jgi:integrase
MASILQNDVDLDAGWLMVRRREAMADRPIFRHRIRIPGWLGKILEHWKSIAGDGDWFFPSTLGGPWDQCRAWEWLKESARAANVDAFATDPFRALRRFYLAHVEPTIVGFVAPLPARTPAREQARRRSASPVPVRVLTVEQARQLMVKLRANSATWDGNRLFAFTAMLLLTGAPRVGMMDLQHENVHLDHSPPFITVIAAGRSSILELSREAAAILGSWIARPDRIGSSYVFPGIHGGSWNCSHSGPGSLPCQLPAAAREAGIATNLRTADLRRVWAQCGGKVDLGEGWHEGKIPDLIATGPPRVGTGRPRSESAIGFEARRLNATKSQAPPVYNPDSVPAVKIGMASEPVFVRGKNKGILPRATYRVVRLLVDVWPEGFTIGEMTGKYGSESWRRLLSRLRDDPDWKSALGRRDGLYRAFEW